MKRNRPTGVVTPFQEIPVTMRFAPSAVAYWRGRCFSQAQMLIVAAATNSPESSAVWTVLFQLLALLGLALLLGMLFERFKQSAILGYLMAGTLLGPGLFNVVDQGSGVPVIAELGVSLLLFAIGLEFSAKRLIKLGSVACVGGAVQVIATLGLAFGVGKLLGLETRTAVAVGAVVALSSTACVLRILTDRAEIDSVHGRTALGILLLQDIAVVPLVLTVSLISGDGGLKEMGFGLLKAFGLIVGLVGAFLILAKFILPRIMRQLSMARDRELLVLLAALLAIGSACAAHALELSPALGAFLAGMMLAESPFATQIRSDIGGLRIVFITLFFASVGMLGDPFWIAEHLPQVFGVTALMMVGKALVITVIALFFRIPGPHAVASGIVLAQVGEFGVVIAGIAEGSGLFSEELFRLLVSATLMTLFITPILIKIALPLGHRIARIFSKGDKGKSHEESEPKDDGKDFVIVVGFGPSGQRVSERLKDFGVSFLVVDMRPNNVDLAKSMGFEGVLGDATSPDFLIHQGISRARAIVVTVPDQRACLRLVESVRTLNPNVAIIVRARYHTFTEDLENAGATVVVDEEYLTGRRLAEAMDEMLSEGEEIKMSKLSNSAD